MVETIFCKTFIVVREFRDEMFCRNDKIISILTQNKNNKTSSMFR